MNEGHKVKLIAKTLNFSFSSSQKQKKHERRFELIV